MSLASEYKRQLGWRAWSEVMDRLPPLAGKVVVLDLGCGIGDQAAQLAERGACVLGLDTNQELLAAAQTRNIPNTEFGSGDLTTLEDGLGVFDGIWCSFAAAYVPNLGPTLACWRQHLTPQGWVAVTEVDDFFGHEPLLPLTTSFLADYARDALAAGRYDRDDFLTALSRSDHRSSAKVYSCIATL